MARMKTPRAGSTAKAVHRGEHARAHEEGAHQAQGEGDDGEKDGPHFQRVALLHHERGMEQRRAGEPRHEGGILHRVPEPEATPAELVIGPPRSHGDAEREAHPGGESPRPHPARPGGVDTPVDQRGDGEGEGHREADIARVEERRVEGERGVLQHRIEALPVEGRRVEPDEGVGRDDDEEQKRRGDRALHGKHIGLQLARQVGAVGRDRRAEQREDQHPQHHGAFMVPPHAGDLVDERLRRMRVGPDILQREVRGDVGHHQRREGNRDEQELHLRRRHRDGHQLRVVAPRAPQAGARSARSPPRARGSARNGRSLRSCSS